MQNIPYSIGSDGFIDLGINAYIWCPHLLHGKFPNFLEAHSMDVLVNSRVTSSLMAEWNFFLPPFFVGAILLGPSWKGYFGFLLGSV